jgi:hypothetical protein
MARSKKAEADYEKSGKRPGTPVSTRLNDATLKRLDAERGDQSRSAWLGDLIARELRMNAPVKRRSPKG